MCTWVCDYLFSGFSTMCVCRAFYQQTAASPWQGSNVYAIKWTDVNVYAIKWTDDCPKIYIKDARISYPTGHFNTYHAWNENSGWFILACSLDRPKLHISKIPRKLIWRPVWSNYLWLWSRQCFTSAPWKPISFTCEACNSSIWSDISLDVCTIDPWCDL